MFDQDHTDDHIEAWTRLDTIASDEFGNTNDSIALTRALSGRAPVAASAFSDDSAAADSGALSFGDSQGAGAAASVQAEQAGRSGARPSSVHSLPLPQPLQQAPSSPGRQPAQARLSGSRPPAPAQGGDYLTTSLSISGFRSSHGSAPTLLPPPSGASVVSLGASGIAALLEANDAALAAHRRIVAGL
jgi:hypothetical protein